MSSPHSEENQPVARLAPATPSSSAERSDSSEGLPTTKASDSSGPRQGLVAEPGHESVSRASESEPAPGSSSALSGSTDAGGMAGPSARESGTESEAQLDISMSEKKQPESSSVDDEEPRMARTVAESQKGVPSASLGLPSSTSPSERPADFDQIHGALSQSRSRSHSPSLSAAKSPKHGSSASESPMEVDSRSESAQLLQATTGSMASASAHSHSQSQSQGGLSNVSSSTVDTEQLSPSKVADLTFSTTSHSQSQSGTMIVGGSPGEVGRPQGSVPSTPPPATSPGLHLTPGEGSSGKYKDAPRTQLSHSLVWTHFKRSEGNATCNFCGKVYKFSGGTSTLRRHLALGRCKNLPPDLQVEAFKAKKSASANSLSGKKRKLSPGSGQQMSVHEPAGELYRQFFMVMFFSCCIDGFLSLPVSCAFRNLVFFLVFSCFFCETILAQCFIWV